MAFTPKDWQDSPTATTPISAAALEDMETRLSAYTDAAVAAPTLKRTVLNMAGTQAVPSPMSGAVKAQWDTGRENAYGWWAGGTSGDITVSDTGLYMVTVCPSWNPQSSTGVRAYHLQVAPLGNNTNAVMLTAHHDQPAVYNGCYPFSWMGSLTATDVLSVWIYHEAGATLNWGGANRPLTSGGSSKNCEICVTKLGS